MDAIHVGKDGVRFEIWMVASELEVGGVKFGRGKTSDVPGRHKIINTISAGKMRGPSCWSFSGLPPSKDERPHSGEAIEHDG
jgi:hypothetical protein